MLSIYGDQNESKHIKIVQYLIKEELSIPHPPHTPSCKYQYHACDMQSARTITLDLYSFELFPLKSFPLCVPQTWGELIVNANALIMHSFFPVIQGND